MISRDCFRQYFCFDPESSNTVYGITCSCKPVSTQDQIPLLFSNAVALPFKNTIYAVRYWLYGYLLI